MGSPKILYKVITWTHCSFERSDITDYFISDRQVVAIVHHQAVQKTKTIKSV